MDAAKVTVQWHAQRRSRSFGGGQRNSQNRIRAQLRFGIRAVERQHGAVDSDLIGGVHANQFISNRGVHILDCLEHAFALEAAFVAIAQFQRLVRAGGCARRHNRAANIAAFDMHIYFHRRIAARIDHLARANVFDHG